MAYVGRVTCGDCFEAAVSLTFEDLPTRATTQQVHEVCLLPSTVSDSDRPTSRPAESHASAPTAITAGHHRHATTSRPSARHPIRLARPAKPATVTVRGRPRPARLGEGTSATATTHIIAVTDY